MDSSTHNTQAAPRRKWAAFWGLFLALALVIGAAAAVVLHYERAARLAELRAEQRQQIQITVELLRQRLADVSADVRWFARLPSLQGLASDDRRNRAEVEAAFLALVEESHQLDQVRYLNQDGEEIVRVEMRDGRPRIVPEAQLQNKAGRYYFKGAIAQRPGVVYASRFDLNVEHGQIQRPFKPVIRLSSRVVDSDGKPRGVLLLNYRGEALRLQIARLLSGSAGRTMLLNADGYWLMAPDPADEWGFMFNREARFPKTHPEAWRQMQSEQGQFRSSDGLYTFATVDPSVVFGARLDTFGAVGAWKLVSHVTPARLSALSVPVIVRVGTVAGVALLLALLFSIWFTRSRSERRQLRSDNVVYLQQALEKQGVLDLFIQHTPAAVAMFDAQLRFMAASRRWYQEYGLRGNLVGRRFDEVFPDSPQRWAEIHRRALEGEVLRAEDDSFTRPDGSVYWLRWEVRPWRTATGSVGGIIMLTESISERKAAEKIRESFIAKVSHELRTPVTALDGALKLLLGGVGGTLSDRAHMLVETAHRNSIRLSVLVNDLLDLQKIKLGKVDLNFSEVYITRVTEDVMAACQPLANQKGVELRVEHQCADPLVVTDGARVNQVLTNFVSNAIRHTPAGRSVTIRSLCEETRIECAVIDEGPGVPEEFKSRIFEDFEQADTGDLRAPGGSGLGLAISRALIHKLGGETGFENLPQGGARFYFLLPRAHAQAAAADSALTQDRA